MKPKPLHVGVTITSVTKTEGPPAALPAIAFLNLDHKTWGENRSRALFAFALDCQEYARFSHN